MEFLHTMRTVSLMVADTLSKNMVAQCCKSSDIDFQDFVSRSVNLETHFPKLEEIYQMSMMPSLWSDLFSIECRMLSNRILLNTNIEVAKLMDTYIFRRGVDPAYSQRMDLLAQIYDLTTGMYNNTDETFTLGNVAKADVNASTLKNTDKISQDYTLGGNDTHYNVSTTNNTHRQTSRSQYDFVNSAAEPNQRYPANRNSIDSAVTTSTMSTIRNDSIPIGYDQASVSSLFSVISNLAVYNERLSKKCSEDRNYYDHCCKKLYYLSEEELLNRPEFIERGRAKAIQFLRQFSRAMGIDKCTHNLALLFFDCYLDRLSKDHQPGLLNSWNGLSTDGTSDSMYNLRSDYHEYSDEEILKIAIACYMLAAGLREHWVDLNKDKYLQHAVDMSNNAFTMREVIAVQLDVLNRMPRGFTTIYTCMEYGLFYLANIKYINHDLGAPFAAKSSGRLEYFDDFMFLGSAFNFLVQTGSLCWLYHCLTKWDDYYISKNWNRFIPPSRSAAVLIFHFFVTFFNIDFEKDLIWCRRFCLRVFKMFYDSDLALWYLVFRENISSFLVCLEKSSDRMYKMRTLFDMSSNVFRSAEASVHSYHARIILEYFGASAASAANNRHASTKANVENLKSNSGQLNNSKQVNNPLNGQLSVDPNNSDQPSKNDSMDLDPNRENCTKSNTNLFGLCYDTISSLFSNILGILRKF
ncbi:hypothetical protein MACK_001431 [Theileria orientalis]|uniref:Uncharacterized protein n=1 Tax=Theileria orientalis TaxID=68886 RepID=A0A976MD09_THEOR|nr:hypothetical protein MACK_001431 [Theileria orientalis]